MHAPHAHAVIPSRQACPAFITGLFFSDTAAPHPWSLVASALSGLVTTVTVYSSSPGAWGLLVNVGLLVVLEGALRVRGKSAGGQTRPALPSWDQAPTARFGELSLTGEVIAYSSENRCPQTDSQINAGMETWV